MTSKYTLKMLYTIKKKKRKKKKKSFTLDTKKQIYQIKNIYIYKNDVRLWSIHSRNIKEENDTVC